jgi:hypothetical protein
LKTAAQKRAFKIIHKQYTMHYIDPQKSAVRRRRRPKI